MATRATFPRLALYSCEFSKASHIFFHFLAFGECQLVWQVLHISEKGHLGKCESSPKNWYFLASTCTRSSHCLSQLICHIVFTKINFYFLFSIPGDCHWGWRRPRFHDAAGRERFPEFFGTENRSAVLLHGHLLSLRLRDLFGGRQVTLTRLEVRLA